MVKILLSLVSVVALTTGASAIGGDAEFCELHPTSPICGSGGEQGPQGPQGEQGPKGDQGEPGRDGQDGATGPKGDTGATGETGATGPRGADGTPGEDGRPGKDGVDGTDGKDGEPGIPGKDGINGINGLNGIDGRVDYTEINKAINTYNEFMESYRKRINEAEEFQADSSAGAAAIASIDFGTTCAGVTEVGIGFGLSSTHLSNGKAGAIGIKHGITDDNAVVLKAWGADTDSYAVGAGFTHRF